MLKNIIENEDKDIKPLGIYLEDKKNELSDLNNDSKILKLVNKMYNKKIQILQNLEYSKN